MSKTKAQISEANTGLELTSIAIHSIVHKHNSS